MRRDRLLKQFNWRFLLVRIVVNAIALALTAAIMPKIYFVDKTLGSWLLMALMLEELGPTYVKMGQIISSQASAIPAEWELELEKLQSDVPPFPSSQVREIVQEELGAAPERLFATFEIEPLAAASTAQVHRATLFSGEEAVVKVQRPGIVAQMRADLGIMQRAGHMSAARSEELRAVDLVGMIIGSAIATSVIAFIRPVGQYWGFASRLVYLGFGAHVRSDSDCPSPAVGLDQKRLGGEGLGTIRCWWQEIGARA